MRAAVAAWGVSFAFGDGAARKPERLAERGGAVVVVPEVVAADRVPVVIVKDKGEEVCVLFCNDRVAADVPSEHVSVGAA